MFYETLNSREDPAAITRMTSSPTSLEMSFIIGLDGISFRTPSTDPLFIVAVFPPVVFLNPNQISKGMAWVVMQTCWFRANEHSFLHFRRFSLQ